MTCPLRGGEAAAPATGQPVSVRSGRGPADWDEVVTHPLAGAAATIGAVEAILAGRPGFWEADGVRNLLSSTFGHDEEHLLEHRTEALVVDELLTELDAWEPYGQASRKLARRYDAIGIATVTGLPGAPLTEEALRRLKPGSEEQQRQADRIADLKGTLEQQRLQDWASYGRALQADLEAEAARLPGLPVPVIARVQQESSRQANQQTGATWRLLDRLLTIQVTELPGEGRQPLARLEAAGKATAAGQPPPDCDGPPASGRS